MIVRIRPFLLVPLPTRKQGFLGYCQQASEDIFRDTDTKNSIFYAKCYRLLQLENNSSKDLVRRQYIKLVKQHHPDTAANDGNLQYFQKIDRAYRELMQKFAEDKRKEEKCIGEYGLYYDETSTDEKNSKYEHPDIQHTAPQHR